MVTLIVVFGVLFVVSIVLGIIAVRNNWAQAPESGYRDCEHGWVHVLCWVVAGCSLTTFLIIGGCAVAAHHQAQIVNAEYGTQYTAEQVFFAGPVIYEVIEGHRQRIDGDLNINME